MARTFHRWSSVLFVIMLQIAYAPGQSNAPGLTCSFTQAQNVHYSGGVYNSTGTSVATCQYACQQQYPSCVGVDYDNNGTQHCWLIMSSSAQSASAPGVDHYTMTCSPATTAGTTVVTSASMCLWNITSNSNSPGGTKQPSIGSQPDCQYACAQSSSCANGYDWNSNLSECWFANSAYVQPSGSFPGCNHYGKLMCYAVTPAKSSAGMRVITSGFVILSALMFSLS